MVTREGRIRIESEEDAWKQLEEALSEGTGVDEGLEVIGFEGWPKLNIYLPKTPIDASISPSMMEALLEMQRAIYRTHRLLASNSGDLRNLSKTEREQLEFRVQVKSGSSGYDIDLTKIAETFVRDAVGRMTGTEIIITVLGVTVILAGTYAFTSWLKHRAEQRNAELDDEEKKRWMSTVTSVLEHDTRRQELLIKAIARQPVLGEVEAAAEVARNQVVRAIGDENGGSFQGIKLDPDLASEVTSQKRQQGVDVRIAGIYRVARVDTTVTDGFRVTLQDTKTFEEITASLQDTIISEAQRTLFQKAEWDKKPLFVELAARRLRNRIIDAVVVGAHAEQPTSD